MNSANSRHRSGTLRPPSFQSRSRCLRLFSPSLGWQTRMEVTTCPIALRSPTTPPVIPAGFANLICDARAWKLNLVKFDFTSPSLISVYSPSTPDTAPGGRDFVRVPTQSKLLRSILVVLPLTASFFPHHPPTTDLGNAGIGQPVGFTMVR